MQDIGRQKEIKELLAETDRRIEELRAVLADMDEIAALRRRRGEPESDDYNGFRRSDVLELLAQQQERRAALAAELQRQNAEEAPKERTSLSAALEKLYEALSADVGRARRDLLQELKFYSRQTSAAYDELSLVIDALADRVAERVIERLGGAAFLAALPAAADAARGEESALPANSPEEISERESASEDISERESTSENISEEENAAEDISEQAPAAGDKEGALSEAPQETASEQAPAETAEAPAVNEEEAPAESSGEESTKAPAETAAVAEEAPAQEAGAESTEAPAETAETAEEDPAAQGEEVGEAQIREEEPAGPQGGAPEEK